MEQKSLCKIQGKCYTSLNHAARALKKLEAVLIERLGT
jgi:hypothetical protein